RSSGVTLTIFEIVSATFGANTNIATKLKNAAQNTAMRGESTRVDTTVAIEFAASWKPLMTSKTSATAVIRTTSRSGVVMNRPRPSGSTSRAKGLPRVSRLLAARGGLRFEACSSVRCGAALDVLQHDAFDDVGHVLAGVGGPLDALEDVAPFDDRDRVLLLL